GCFDLKFVKCPQPIVTSTNEACVVSCGDSRVIIYPPPVIVTFPGPILSTCPQESLVGAAVPCESGVPQSATTVPLTSEIGGMLSCSHALSLPCC
uniref:Keratin n=1 Tax=Crocodylus porosus TaxID=8502 RepID=A0A7M4F7H1_CROPO